MITPELMAYVVQGESAVRAGVSDLAALLVAYKKDHHDSRSPELDRLFQVVLEACAYTGRGALDYSACLQLLSPFGDRFGKGEPLDRWLPLLVPVAARRDINKGFIKEEFLSRVPSPDTRLNPVDEPTRPLEADQTGLLDRATQAGRIVETVFPDEPPAFGEGPSAKEWSSFVSAWGVARREHPQPSRDAWDVWMIRSSLLASRPLPLGYVEQLSEDDDFWSSDACAEFAQGLSEPPPPAAVGRVQSALLNSRLRFLRPRIFLRSPQSLVVLPIAERMDTGGVEEALVEEISYPFIRSLRTMRSEIARCEAGDLSPRISVLRELESYLDQVLERLGLRLDGVEGAVISFDPAGHIGVGSFDVGESVRVVQPGLVDIRSGRRVQKTTVAAVPEPSHQSEDPEVATEPASSATPSTTKEVST